MADEITFEELVRNIPGIKWRPKADGFPLMREGFVVDEHAPGREDHTVEVAAVPEDSGIRLVLIMRVGKGDDELAHRVDISGTKLGEIILKHFND